MSECNKEREARLAISRGNYPINLNRGNKDRCTSTQHLVQRVPTCKGVNREREKEGQLADLVSYRI